MSNRRKDPNFKAPVDPASFALSETPTIARLITNEDGTVRVQATVGVLPSSSTLTAGSTGSVTLQDPTTSSQKLGIDANGIAKVGIWNGALQQNVLKLGDLIAKSVDLTAAGSTAVWTPAAGKKFRLMAFEVNVGTDASLAAAGTQTIRLLDGATRIWGVQLQMQAAVSTGVTAESHVVVLPGNGYLSSAANNVLNGNLNTVMNTGSITFNVYGLEE